jgi:hypothetical protein
VTVVRLVKDAGDRHPQIEAAGSLTATIVALLAPGAAVHGPDAAAAAEF